MADTGRTPEQDLREALGFLRDDTLGGDVLRREQKADEALAALERLQRRHADWLVVKMRASERHELALSDALRECRRLAVSQKDCLFTSADACRKIERIAERALKDSGRG